MNHAVAILEDDANRILEMETCLKELLPGATQHFFDNSGEMIDWLKQNLAYVVLMSLDHDLPFVQYRNGTRVEAGCGRDLADYLASVPPTCPVIIHTSNYDCGNGMEQVLKEAGWPRSRVHPQGDYEWVRDAWLPELKRLISEGWVAA